MSGTAQLRQSDPTEGVIQEQVLCIEAQDLHNTSGSRHKNLLSQIRNACLKNGFFYIQPDQNQRTAQALVSRQMDALFSLGDNHHVKQSIARGDGDYGWTPSFNEPAYQPGTVSKLESFDCGLTDICQSSNRDIWPELPGFQHDLIYGWRSYVSLGSSVLALISEALNLNHNFLPDSCDSRALNTFRLLHYPPSRNKPSDNTVGIAAHTDFECITLIYQSSPGLELTDQEGRWFDAPSADGRIVVLLGDMLEIWTNGFIKATGHRVRDTNLKRYSQVMFFAANEEMEISPLSNFTSNSRPSAYQVTTQA